MININEILTEVKGHLHVCLLNYLKQNAKTSQDKNDPGPKCHGAKTTYVP